MPAVDRLLLSHDPLVCLKAEVHYQRAPPFPTSMYPLYFHLSIVQNVHLFNNFSSLMCVFNAISLKNKKCQSVRSLPLHSQFITGA